MSPTFDNRRGIVAMIIAMAAFTVTDSLMKYATASLPVSQIIALRGALAFTMTLAWLRSAGGLAHLGALRHPRVLQRTFFETTMIVAYVSALARAPIADVFSVLQSAPILITAFAALVWGEKVGWRRWSAIFVGFAGVALIVRPSPAGLDPAMGLALVAALMVAGRDLTTRAIPPVVPSPLITLSATIGSTLAGLLLAPFEAWTTPEPQIWAVLLAAAGAVACGNFAVITAYRTAEASVISPFRYAGVPIAIVIGWVVWRNVPDALAFVGIAMIVAAGLYTMRRQSAPTSAAVKKSA